MIQRIQTVYLFIASLITGICAYWIFENSAYEEPYNFLIEIPKEIKGEISIRFLESSLILITAMSVISVFLFKSRGFQRFFCNINCLLHFAIFLAALFLTIDTDLDDLPYDQLLILLTPLFSVTFVSLAIGSIKKDQELIKSMDRLR